MKAVAAAFNQEKALVGAFSVIVQLHRLIVYSTTSDDLTVEMIDAMARRFQEDAQSGPDLVASNGWIASPYFVSKILLSALTRVQQRQFNREDDIVVNHIHPGFVDTDLSFGLTQGLLDGALCTDKLVCLNDMFS